MAIFSTRSSSQRGQDAARKSNVPVDSVETLRTRARQRLIGAVVLVVLGVVGSFLLFDTQPRPIPVDIEISIPDKDKAERLEMPAAATVTTAPSAVGKELANSPASAPPNVQASASLGPKEELLSSNPPVKDVAKAEPKAEVKVDIKPEVKTEKKVEKQVEKKAEVAVAAKVEAKAETKAPVKPPVVVDDGAKAKAILEGKEPAKEPAKESVKEASDAADGNSRFVVQVGAFADGTKAQEVRVKLERAGLKTYTHVAQTKDGARTRVRVGPFAKRDEAEKAATKIKKLDLPAAILTL